MIAKVIAQMLLSFSVLTILPVDAGNLEWKIGIPIAPNALAASMISLTSNPVTLPIAGDRFPPPKKTDLSSYGVVTNAQSIFVADTQSGTALFAKNPDDIRSIGSITKLMTALVFLDSKPDLKKWVNVIDDDYVGGAHVNLNFNDAIRIKDILGASIVGSDNTATKALSRLSNLSPADFIIAMNAKAKELGMTSSTFVEVTGIDAGNTSTARDLMMLLAEAKRRPELVAFMTSSDISVMHASGESKFITSTDMLFDSLINKKPYAIVAGKTGYIPEAGYCFITMITHDGDEIFVAVLGASTKEDRFNDAKAIAIWAFDTFTWPKL